MQTKTLRQAVTIKTTPDKVYGTFMDSRKHSRFTGSRARISKRIGGEFSVYDDYATGKNLELIPNQLIRQSWRSADWPDGMISEIKLELEATHLGTRISFTHKGIPPGDYEKIKSGWTEFYWKPLRAYLEK